MLLQTRACAYAFCQRTSTKKSISPAQPPLQECPLDLDGLLEVRCPATGLGAELRFKPFRQQYIKG